MNREEALHIFSHSEEIVSASEVNASIERMAAAIRAQHPYQVPELLALPVSRGLDAYLSWLEDEVRG